MADVSTATASPTRSSPTLPITPSASSPARLDGSFAAQQTFAAGVDPFAVAVSDVNGDGKLDLITANLGSNSVSLLLGEIHTLGPASTLVFQQQPGTVAPNTPFSVAVAVQDSFGNTVLANSSTVTLTLSPGSTFAAGGNSNGADRQRRCDVQQSGDECGRAVHTDGERRRSDASDISGISRVRHLGQDLDGRRSVVDFQTAVYGSSP